MAYQCILDASHKNNTQQWYLEELMRLAQEEMRARLEQASQRVEQMIDSGWVPNDGATVESLYCDMFAQFPDMKHDSFSDLYEHIDSAFGKVGLPPRVDKIQAYRRRLGDAQVEFSKEFATQLDAYMESKKTESQSNHTTVNVHGDVGNFQSGGVSHITQHFGAGLPDVVRALEDLKIAAKESGEPQASEIEQVIDAAIETARKPGATAVVVGTIVSGAQDMIRTAGAVPTAWNLLASLLTPFGLHLPQIPSEH
ncbi:MAG: hypothetical protein EPN48_18275 [Microbacteriaceae bacterium]|nr:MAG: hypothetical protein EPN48_18275 [Microbacteriaceae bacterium]